MSDEGRSSNRMRHLTTTTTTALHPKGKTMLLKTQKPSRNSASFSCGKDKKQATFMRSRSQSHSWHRHSQANRHRLQPIHTRTCQHLAFLYLHRYIDNQSYHCKFHQLNAAVCSWDSRCLAKKVLEYRRTTVYYTRVEELRLFIGFSPMVLWFLPSGDSPADPILTARHTR